MTMSRCFALPALALIASGCLFTADQIDPVTKPVGAATSSGAVFALLRQAYETRSLTTLDQILSDDYQFVADAREQTGSTDNTWGKAVEMDRHSRMFQAAQISNFILRRDSLSPHPESAPRETTWTVFDLEMHVSYDGQEFDVQGQADFRLRAVPQADGSNLYAIVKWTDRNQ